MKTILFLVSGNGGTLKFINEAYKENRINLKVIAVIADRKCGATQYAKKSNIKTHEINLGKDNQENLKQLIQIISPDFVVTNIHRILHNNIISLSEIQFINLHYSLLPSYAGLIGMDTIKKAKIDNTMFIGATTHLVNEDVDKGLILGQCLMASDWTMNTIESYYDIIFRGGCFILLNQLLELSDNKSTNNTVSNYHQLIFNPALTFPPLDYSTSFWDKLK